MSRESIPAAPDASGQILAIKFGGTSVATPSRVRAAARRVRMLCRLGWRPVVVVSAAGLSTDRLLVRLESVAAHPPGATANGDRLFARERDRALATGEDRSAAMLAASLCALGVPAESVRAHEAVLRAEGPHGSATLRQLDDGAVARALATGTVPVVAGFQGVRDDGELVTLGRGSSDVTAVFLATAVGADACHIVTDVDGVFDLDPRTHATARLYRALEPEALVRLCEAGAQVIHAEAARRARDAELELHVYKYDAPLAMGLGTRIAEGAGARRQSVRAGGAT